MNRSLFTIGVIMASCMLYACGHKKQKKPDTANMAVPVTTYSVHMQRAVYFDNFPATVVPMMEVEIHAEAEGYITGIFFKEGQHVKKGQKLYTIDDTKYRASYNQAEANVRVAESYLAQSQKDAERYIYLDKHDAIAKQLLDHQLTSLKNAKDSVRSAKQNLQKVRADLDYTVIRAPFDGIIGISKVKLGNTVTLGQTVLNTISTDGTMALEFVVNEKQLPRFIKLQQHPPAQKDSIFTMLMPNNMLYNQLGKIYVIDRGVNPQTGSIIVRLAFPDPGSELRAGMSATVRVRNDDTTSQLVIPGRAVTEQMGEYFVYIAKDTLMPTSNAGKDSDGAKGKDDSKDKQKDKGEHKGKEDKDQAKPMLHALQRKVILGQTLADSVIVKSGLKAGDTIVTDGVQKLHDGSVITRANVQGPQQGQGGKGK